MLSTPPDSFRQHYQALVSSGTIERDAAQARIVDAFAALEPFGASAASLKAVARYLVDRTH